MSSSPPTQGSPYNQLHPSSLLWAHIFRKPTPAQPLPSSADLTPQDKARAATRILLHDTQARLETFAEKAEGLMREAVDAKCEVSRARADMEGLIESLAGDMAQLVNRCQGVIVKSLGAPAQARDVEDLRQGILHAQGKNEERSERLLDSVHSLTKITDIRAEENASWHERQRQDMQTVSERFLGAIGQLNDTYSREMSTLQTDMQAVRECCTRTYEHYAGLVAHVSPLLPLLQDIPSRIERAKDEILQKHKIPTASVISGTSGIFDTISPQQKSIPPSSANSLTNTNERIPHPLNFTPTATARTYAGAAYLPSSTSVPSLDVPKPAHIPPAAHFVDSHHDVGLRVSQSSKRKRSAATSPFSSLNPNYRPIKRLRSGHSSGSPYSSTPARVYISSPSPPQQPSLTKAPLLARSSPKQRPRAPQAALAPPAQSAILLEKQSISLYSSPRAPSPPGPLPAPTFKAGSTVSMHSNPQSSQMPVVTRTSILRTPPSARLAGPCQPAQVSLVSPSRTRDGARYRVSAVAAGGKTNVRPLQNRPPLESIDAIHCISPSLTHFEGEELLWPGSPVSTMPGRRTIPVEDSDEDSGT